MKRTPLKRKTPLKAKTGLKRTPFRRRRSKFGNVKTMFNGTEYDSKLEADRAAYLLARLQAGEISELREQVTFKLTRAQIEYIADFVYVENGRTVVEDTKGHATDAFNLKARLWAYYGPGYPLLVVAGVYGNDRKRTGWKIRKRITAVKESK